MKGIVTILASLLTCTVVAQNEHIFNKVFAPDTAEVQSVALVNVDSGFLLSGSMGTANYSGFYLKKINNLGEGVWVDVFDSGQEFRSMITGGCLINMGNHIMFAGSKSKIPFGEDRDIYLVKFSLDGNILWENTYGDTVKQTPRQILPTADNGYLIVGAQQYQLNPAYFYALKIDSAGTVEWENTYGLDGHSAAFSAVQTQDGSYLISGYGYHLTKGYESLLVKTDAAGNEEWQTHYGTLEDDAAAHITRKGADAYWMIGGTREGGNYNLFVQEVDGDGNQVWHKSYYKNTYFASQTGLVVLPDGNLAAAGFYANTSNSGTTGFLAKFTPGGDTLWVRGYQTDPFTQDYFRDVDVAPDGGYLLTGFVYESPQKSWVVKTDAEGNTCSFVGCDSTLTPPLAAPLVERNPYRVSVSPNPARGWAEVGYRLPMRSPCGHIRLYTLSGREVLAARLHTYTRSRRLDLSGLPAGVYPYEVTFEGRRVYAGKLVVE